jgi:hypothetical protein
MAKPVPLANESALAKLIRWYRLRRANPRQYLNLLREHQARSGFEGLRPSGPEAYPEAFKREMEEIGSLFPEHADAPSFAELQRRARESGFLMFNFYYANSNVVGTLQRHGFGKVTEQTAVGELLLPEINACAIKVPAGGFVIGINIGLAAVMEVVGNLLLSQIGMVVTEGNEVKVTLHPVLPRDEVVRYVFAAIGGYLFSQNPYMHLPGGLRLLPLIKERLVLASTLQVSAEFFVLAHEYGHIAAGHLAKESRLMMMAGQSLKTTSKTTQQEHDADVAADLLLFRWSREDPDTRVVKAGNTIALEALSMICCGPFYFLTVADLIEKVQRVLHRISADNVTHPSCEDRKAVLRKITEDTLVDLLKNAANAAELNIEDCLARVNQVYTGLDEVANSMWNEFSGYTALQKSKILSGFAKDARLGTPPPAPPPPSVRPGGDKEG